MANFKLSQNGLDITSFDLPLNRTVTLFQSGGDGQGNKLELALSPSTSTINLKVLPDKLPAASTAFTLEGKTQTEKANVSACIQGSGSTQKCSEDLSLEVFGDPRKQPTYDVDLLSELAISGNSGQIHAYSRIIKGPQDESNPLSQDTSKPVWDCGDVAAAYGPKFFSKKTSVTYLRYYLTPTSDKLADLKFDGRAITAGIARIKNFLSKGNPVRVWAIHDDGFKKVIAGDWRTHFLTIIGCSHNKFLYFDPWPSGSVAEYDGGMYPKTTVKFMGELTFDLQNPSNGINSANFPDPPLNGGSHTYRIIGGP